MAMTVLFGKGTICLSCFELARLFVQFFGQNSLESFHCSFLRQGWEGGRRAPSCSTVFVKLSFWLLVTMLKMAAASCRSGFKIDLFGYACLLSYWPIWLALGRWGFLGVFPWACYHESEAQLAFPCQYCHPCSWIPCAVRFLTLSAVILVLVKHVSVLFFTILPHCLGSCSFWVGNLNSPFFPT